MKYLLDTNIWSGIQRGDPRLLANIRRLPEDAVFCMSVVVLGELIAGVERLPNGKRKDDLRRLYQESIAQSAEFLNIDIRVAERFGVIVGQLRRDGRPIETNDIWIAATALANDLIVVTADADFGHVAGLRVEDWTVGQVD